MAVDTTIQKSMFFTGVHGFSMREDYYDLFVAQATAADGVWMETLGWETLHVSFVINSSTGTCKIGGSGAETALANSADGVDITTELTASGYFTLERHQLPRWIKVHPHAVGASVSIFLKVTRFVGNDITT